MRLCNCWPHCPPAASHATLAAHLAILQVGSIINFAAVYLLAPVPAAPGGAAAMSLASKVRFSLLCGMAGLRHCAAQTRCKGLADCIHMYCNIDITANPPAAACCRCLVTSTSMLGARHVSCFSEHRAASCVLTGWLQLAAAAARCVVRWRRSPCLQCRPSLMCLCSRPHVHARLLCGLPPRQLCVKGRRVCLHW